MRIIGGEYRGRIITLPKNFKARPTTDLAKESLFNIMQNRIEFEGLKVLDLFAGTGNISYEFLSRGNNSVTMIELNFQHVQFIKSVLREFNEKAIVIRSDAFRYLTQCNEQFDFIFADPPYDHPEFDKVAPLVLSRNLLLPNGWFIMEHPKSFDFKDSPLYVETRRYGQVHFSFFHNALE